MKYSDLHGEWKLESRDDLAEILKNIVLPLEKYRSKNGALIKTDGCGYTFTDEACYIEGFSRVLWGIAPLLAGGWDYEMLEKIQLGIKNGTNPQNEEYWGNTADRDQRFVEMAALAYSIILRRDLFWDCFTKSEQQNFYNWLNQINTHELVDNNWNYFRILVCLAFKHVGLTYDESLFTKTLDRIETFYRGDGWYQDGDVGTYDYYNGWAFHFYSAVYIRCMKHRDVERCKKFAKRLIEHAEDLKTWFSHDGSNIPMGRSITYRFAASSIYAALGIAGIENVDYGEAKAIVLQNMRYWLQQDIFDRDGILSIGYTYPNLFLSEDYNSPNSPYWSLKVFAVLALDDTHPFWANNEKQWDVKTCTTQKIPGFLVQRMDEDNHVVLLSGKQYRWTDSNYFFSNFAYKYGKFAYSSKYGFSIARGTNSIEQGAFDSSLSFKDGDYFRTRTKQTLVDIGENYLISRWLPWDDVVVDTTLVVFEGWHIRVHKIASERKLESYEGGFCIQRPNDSNEGKKTEQEGLAIIETKEGLSLVQDIFSNRQGKVFSPEANTNTMFKKTFLPTLIGEISIGTTFLVSAVFAGECKDYIKKKQKNVFSLDIKGEEIKLFANKTLIHELGL